jgi:hypothetical protein
LVGREGFGFGEVVGAGAVEKGQPREAARANHLLPSRVAVGAVCVSWPCARCLNMNPVFRRWVRTARSVSQGGRVRAQLLASSLAPSRALWLVPSWEALRAGTAMGVGIIHGHRSWSTARCGGSCVEAIRPTVWVDREIRMCCLVAVWHEGWLVHRRKLGWICYSKSLVAVQVDLNKGHIKMLLLFYAKGSKCCEDGYWREVPASSAGLVSRKVGTPARHCRASAAIPSTRPWTYCRWRGGTSSGNRAIKFAFCRTKKYSLKLKRCQTVQITT